MMSMTELFYGPNEPTWIVNHQQHPGWKRPNINNENLDMASYPSTFSDDSHIYRRNPLMQRPATPYSMVAPPVPMEAPQFRGSETAAYPFHLQQQQQHQQQQLQQQQQQQQQQQLFNATLVPYNDVAYRVQENQAQVKQSPARVAGVLQPRNNINLHTVHFMVPLCCAHCEKKVKDELMDVDDVERVTCDQWNKRVTVTSTVAPERLLKRLQKIKKLSTFWPQQQLQQQPQSVNAQIANQAHILQQLQQQQQQQQQQAGIIAQNNNHRNQVKFQQLQQNQHQNHQNHMSLQDQNQTQIPNGF